MMAMMMMMMQMNQSNQSNQYGMTPSVMDPYASMMPMMYMQSMQNQMNLSLMENRMYSVMGAFNQQSPSISIGGDYYGNRNHVGNNPAAEFQGALTSNTNANVLNSNRGLDYSSLVNFNDTTTSVDFSDNDKRRSGRADINSNGPEFQDDLNTGSGLDS